MEKRHEMQHAISFKDGTLPRYSTVVSIAFKEKMYSLISKVYIYCLMIKLESSKLLTFQSSVLKLGGGVNVNKEKDLKKIKINLFIQ